EVVAKLFSVARRYQLTLQPQLILLQKTLLNIEGIGRLLHPQIDIWATAKPVLAGILRERRSPRRVLRKLRERLPEWVAAAPELPALVHTFLKKAAAGDFDAQRGIEREQRERLSRAQRRQLAVLPLAAASLLGAALLYAFDTHAAQWLHVPVSAWIALAISTGAFTVAWRSARN
ncbi:MAG TPA: ubiquinone biosynthesis regulatory protein kinase UbiB, partial [Rudaea sp.]|nr:ubiquinone biosynthesis regulatory protein kinase UbiB [Rudaea sp.]